MNKFFDTLEKPFTGEQLFDCLSDTVFFIKNAEGKYLIINKTLVDRCGLKDKSELIGKTANEVIGSPYGKSFEVQDEKVISSGKSLLNKLELHAYLSHEYEWCLTSKLPLFGKSGSIIGLVGISKDISMPDISSKEHKQLSLALKFAENNLDSHLTVKKIAKVATMSSYQFDRRIQRVFGLTAGQWLLKLRIDFAEHQLLETNLSIADIALNIGYSDQSTFSRQFHLTVGMSPSNYRIKNHLK